MRFCGPLTDESIVSLLNGLDWQRSLFLGCFVDNALRGVAHVCNVPDRSDEAEFAVSVEKPFRRTGIATALAQAALRLSRDRAVRAMNLTALPDNSPMKQLATKLGFSMSNANQQAIGRLTWTESAQVGDTELALRCVSGSQGSQVLARRGLTRARDTA